MQLHGSLTLLLSILLLFIYFCPVTNALVDFFMRCIQFHLVFLVNFISLKVWGI